MVQMIIGTLGPEGSYSEKAAKQWNMAGKLHYYDDIQDTVEAHCNTVRAARAVFDGPPPATDA